MKFPPSLPAMFVLAVFAASGVPAPASGQEPSAANNLQNGSFEDGLNVWKIPSSGVDLKIDPSGASEGEGFIRVTVPPERTMAVTQELSGLEPGQRYRVCARVRKNSSEDARFIVRNVDTGKYLVWKSMTASDDWTPIEMSFTAPADGATTWLEFNFRNPGSCEIDEVTVTRQD